MSDRDRLIELLKIPHKAEQLRQMGVTIKNYEDDCVEAMIADYLLSNGVICPPCKVGDTVYSYDKHRRSPIIKCCVDELLIDSLSKGKLIIVMKDEYNRRMAFFEDSFGKTVFLSREEAEKALKALREKL